MRMSPFILALIVLGGGGLQAHEVGLLISKSVGKAQAAETVLFGQPKASYDEVSPTGQGARLGWSLVDLKVAEVSVVGTWHTQGESRVVGGGTDTGLKYRGSYLAVGGQVEWKLLVNLTAGLDLRKESLELGPEKVSQTRPWIRAGVGFSLPIPVLSPFVKLEAAVPTVKEGRTDSQSAMVKALAPQFQLAAYAGVRF